MATPLRGDQQPPDRGAGGHGEGELAGHVGKADDVGPSNRVHRSHDRGQKSQGQGQNQCRDQGRVSKGYLLHDVHKKIPPAVSVPVHQQSAPLVLQVLLVPPLTAPLSHSDPPCRNGQHGPAQDQILAACPDPFPGGPGDHPNLGPFPVPHGPAHGPCHRGRRKKVRPRPPQSFWLAAAHALLR